MTVDVTFYFNVFRGIKIMEHSNKLFHLQSLYNDVSVNTWMLHPLLSNLEEYHILRFISLFMSENLVLGRFSDKNISYEPTKEVQSLML